MRRFLWLLILGTGVWGENSLARSNPLGSWGLLPAMNMLAVEPHQAIPSHCRRVEISGRKFFLGDCPNSSALPSKNRVHELIEQQTPIRDLGDRISCSIFSSIAALESMLKINGIEDRGKDFDFSEQWLAYLVSRYRATLNSSTSHNFFHIFSVGLVSEADLPYDPDEWVGVKPTPQKAKERCGHIFQWDDPNKNIPYESCLQGHFDQELLAFPDEVLESEKWARRGGREISGLLTKAKNLLKSTLQPLQSFPHAISDLKKHPFRISVEDAKRLLSLGIPVLADFEFFFAAWNHSKAYYPLQIFLDEDIDGAKQRWALGSVGFPEPGSLDAIQSIGAKFGKPRIGHSVLLVGYDDEKEMEIENRFPVFNSNGTLKEKNKRIVSVKKRRKIKGVYYFKNSWGKERKEEDFPFFGEDFQIDGRAYPGYGEIAQVYLEKHAFFYWLPLGAKISEVSSE